MKNFIFAVILAGFSFSSARAQSCDVKIEVLPDQFMHGKIEPADAESQRLIVEFKEDVMEVLVPLNGKNYILSVRNENCQAYCKRDKRVRQLNSGDEKLVRNLLKIREQDIIAQIQACGL